MKLARLKNRISSISQESCLPVLSPSIMHFIPWELSPKSVRSQLQCKCKCKLAKNTSKSGKRIKRGNSILGFFYQLFFTTCKSGLSILVLAPKVPFLGIFEPFFFYQHLLSLEQIIQTMVANAKNTNPNMNDGKTSPQIQSKELNLYI